MRKLSIELVPEGSILAKPVYGTDNLMLLSVGTELSEVYLNRLKKLGFNYLYVMDGLIDDVEAEHLISDSTQNNAIKCLKEASRDIQNNMTVSTASLNSVVSDIIDQVFGNNQLMACLTDICSYDDYTFNHSVNVTILSVMLGMCLGYNKNKLFDLGMGVILHDIGKLEVPIEITDKPGKLTSDEYEIMKQHTAYGFDKLRKNSDIRITSAHVAFQHHERYDGTGYPRGLAKEAIHEYARICAIADVFDAMGRDRCYRKKIPLKTVTEYLKKESGYLFDPYIVEMFSKRVAVYPQGTLVTLNDGRSGLVVAQNNNHPDHPIIRLFWNSDGTDITEPVEINLLKETGLSISKVVDDIKPPLLK